METLLVGRTLGERYAIEEVIGRGGMSVVFRATDTRLGRPVAVKVVSLPPSGAEERFELRERLRREAASAARIPPHPNVVQVYDHGTDERLDLDFIVMELLSGRDLREALREGPPEPAAALRILREAARGVAAGHRAGLVHRDVKPANIFLSGEGGRATAKILDFGIAKALEIEPGDDLTRTGLVPHSPAYASPEQLRGEKRLTPAADVYQLGLVGYELLAGERPFGEAERRRMGEGGAAEPPERGRWGEVDAGVREVVRRALRPRPEERFPDAARFVEALSAAAESAPEETELAAEPPVVPVAPEAEGAIPARRPGRRAQLAVAGALAVLGLWGISRIGGETPAEGPASPGVAAVDVAALDEEFRDLQREAVDRLREEGSEEAGQEAADAVVRTLVDLNEAWVSGDLERHLSHYADRVDFYGAEGARRSRIARERGRELERYPEREIVLGGHAVTFPEPGRARALVEKSWTFGGGDEPRRGSGRQEYVLELEDGRWRVVEERLVELYEGDEGRR